MKERKRVAAGLGGACFLVMMLALNGAATVPATMPAPRADRLGRWEALPAGVYCVFVGPDQRRWSVSFPEGMRKTMNVGAIKGQIAEQWKQAGPMLRDCWPMLFEKGGAVWFVTSDRGTLLRYDGKEWLTQAAHALPKGEGKFIGVCPGFGRSTDYMSNMEVGDMRLFIEREGISVFDGTNWTYQKLMENAQWAILERVAMLVEKDGKGVLAYDTLSNSLWRCREGKWKRLAVPGWIKKAGASNGALGPDGTLWLTTSSGLQRFSVDGGKAAATEGARANYLPGLTADLPEFRINGLDVNEYWAKICADEAGNVYVGVTGVRPEVSKNGRGTFVIKADGAAHFYPGSAVGYGLTGFYQTPMFCADGRTIWCNSNLMGGDRRICRIDLTDEATAVHRPVSEELQFLQAVAADGTAYLSINDPLEPFGIKLGGEMLPSVSAYHPDEASDAAVVRPAGYEVGDNNATVASDGAVWAWRPLEGLCRFDGREWKAVDPTASAGERSMTGGHLFAGREGSMLAWSEGRTSEDFVLFEGGKRMEGADLPKLIRENREAFVKAFGGRQDAGLWLSSQQRMFIMAAGPEGGFSIAVDKQDRIWLAINRTLSVLEEDWTKYPWPSPQQPAPRQGIMGPSHFVMPNGPSLIVPVSGGEAMYVVDYRGEVEGAGKAYLATMKEGKMKWTDAPAPQEGLVQAGDGALWVAYRQAGEGKKLGTPADEILMERLDAEGATEKQVIPAPPALMDSSGVMWLAARGDQKMRSGEFVLWKGGEAVGRARAAGVWESGNMVSDGAGSVWVWTNLGLQHLTAEDAKRPMEYKVKSSSVVVTPEEERVRFGSVHFVPCDQGMLISGWFNGGSPMTGYRVLLMATAGK